MSGKAFLLMLSLLSGLAFGQLESVDLSSADKATVSTTDWLDKLTNSRIFKTSLVWYKNVRDVVKVVNREYDLFMRGIRILHRELSFIEYMARKIEKISNYRFDPNNFWKSMFELEDLFDMIDDIYTTDLEYFDYLIGCQRDVIKDLFNADMPDFVEAYNTTRRIWGSLPVYYRTDSKLKKLPQTKITSAAGYTTLKGYRASGSALRLVAKNGISHQKTKAELDKINDAPVKYLQFENSFYLDMLFEKLIYLDNLKHKVTGDCQILLSKSSFKDLDEYNKDITRNTFNDMY